MPMRIPRMIVSAANIPAVVASSGRTHLGVYIMAKLEKYPELHAISIVANMNIQS